MYAKLIKFSKGILWWINFAAESIFSYIYDSGDEMARLIFVTYWRFLNSELSYLIRHGDDQFLVLYCLTGILQVIF